VGINTTTPDAPLDVTMSNDALDVANTVYTGTSSSVFAQESAPTGIFFSPDGLNVYVNGTNTDQVEQYKLSKAWDISSLAPFGNFSVVSEDGAPQSVFIGSSGTKMFIAGNTTDTIYQYTLSTAYDITSATYDSVSFNVNTYDATPTGVVFKPDGLTMYLCGSSQDKISQFSLASAWSISSPTFVGDVSVTNPADLSFSDDGVFVFTTDTVSDRIYQYRLGTAWDITTATLVNSFSVLSQEGNTTGIYYKTDTNTIFTVGSGNDNIYAYVIPALKANGSAQVTGDLVVGGNVYAGGLNGYVARAWVNFNGTGTPSIRASGNVSSITDNDVGDAVGIGHSAISNWHKLT
jgi:sugar lactone lactonase YvrE